MCPQKALSPSASESKRPPCGVGVAPGSLGRGILFSSLLLLAACSATLHPPAPQQGIFAVPQREPSVLSLPVVLDLPTLAQDLEKALDGGALGKSSHQDNGLQWSVGLRRTGPVRLQAHAGHLQCELPLLLHASAQGKGLFAALKSPSLEQALPLNLEISLPASGQGALDLQIPAIHLPGLHDVLRKSTLVSRLVGQGSQSLDSLLRSVLIAPLQRQLDSSWAALHKPLQIGNEGWLAIRPDSLLFSGTRILDSNRLQLDLGVVAAIRFSTDRPTDAPATRWVLALTEPRASVTRIHLPVQASWPALETRLRKELRGKKFGNKKRWMRIENLSLRGIGTTDAAGGSANGMLLSLDFTAETGSWLGGNPSGTLHMTAYPSLDTATQTLSLSGFSLSSESRSLLLDQGLEWIADLAYDKILEQARLDLGSATKAPLASLDKQLRTGLSLGPLTLSGSVGTVRFAGLFLDGGNLEPWFVANASFELGNKGNLYTP